MIIMSSSFQRELEELIAAVISEDTVQSNASKCIRQQDKLCSSCSTGSPTAKADALKGPQMYNLQIRGLSLIQARLLSSSLNTSGLTI